MNAVKNYVINSFRRTKNSDHLIEIFPELYKLINYDLRSVDKYNKYVCKTDRFKTPSLFTPNVFKTKYV
jgi:hypothetical protein